MDLPFDFGQVLGRLYDKYSPVMYSVAMQITSSEHDSEQILIYCFKKIAGEKWVDPAGNLSSLAVIKLTIKTAYEIFPKFKGNHLPLKQFSFLPVLNKLLCEDAGIKSPDNVYYVTQFQSFRNMKTEAVFPNIRKRFVIRVITIPVD